MTIKFTGDYATYFKPSSPFKDMITEASWRGAEVQKIGTTGLLEINDDEALSVAEAIALVGAGVEIEGLPLMIEMTPTKYNGNVPAGIPNRTKEDAEGNETILKWSEWKKPNNEHFQYGTKHYVMTNANVAPAYLKGSEFVILNGVSGYTLKTMPEFKAIQDASEGV